MHHPPLLAPWLSQRRHRQLLAGPLLALGYVLLAWVGFAMAVPPGLAAPFWPAAGIGLAGTLLLGSQAWPWVFAGAFFATLSRETPAIDISQALIIAGAAALQAGLAARLVGGVFSPTMTMNRERSVLRFLLLGAAVAPAVSTTLLIASLVLSGRLSGELALGQWLTWWSGDAIGIALITPIVLFICSPVAIFSRMFFMHVAPLVLVLAFISGGHTALNYYQREAHNDLVKTIITQAHSDFHESIASILQPLNSTASFLLASDFVSEAEFDLFVGNELAQAQHAMLAWAPRVTAQQRAAFERDNQLGILAMDEGNMTEPEAQRATYYPVTRIHPTSAAATYRGVNVLSNCFDPYPLAEAIHNNDLLFIPPASRRCRHLDVTYIIKPVHLPDTKHAVGVLVAAPNLNVAMSRLIKLTQEQGLELEVTTAQDGQQTTELLSTKRHFSHQVAALDDAIGENNFTIRLLAPNAYWQQTNSPITYLYILFSLVSAFAISASGIGSANRQAMNAFEIRERTQSLTRELSARQQAEQQLARSATLLSTAVDMAELGVWEVDFQKEEFVLNDSLLRMLGDKPGAGEQRRMGVAEFLSQYMPEEDRRQALANFNGHQPQRFHFELEHQLIRVDGHAITVQSQCHIERDRQQQPVYGRGISLNVSRFRDAEAQLRKARDDAEAATRAKSEFLARMSHEIRTPMNGVIGMLELLLQDSANAHQRNSLDIAHTSARQLLDIIDDILDFSKIEAGGLTLERIPFSVQELLTEVLDLMAPIAQQKAVQLHAYVRSSAPQQLVGDPVRLRQILINLIGNAIKYSVTPGLTARVQVLVAGTGDQLRIDILDNGIGIPKDTLPKLFTPFSQADESTTRHFGGTGLGLTISKELAELMGGTIVASSTPKQKTCFSLRLPLPPTTPHQDQSSAALPDLLLCGIAADCAAAIRGDAQAAGSDCYIIRHPNDGARLSGQRPVVLLSHSAEVVLSTGEQAALCKRLSVDRVISVGGEAATLSDRHIALGNTPLSLALIAKHSLANPAPQAQHSRRPAPASRPAASNIRRNHPRLLVAEDSDINRKVIAQQLQHCGYNADFACDGDEALARWEQGDYPVVITDLHMPKRDGYSLAQEIRRREQGRKGNTTVIIALSANAQAGAQQKSSAAGFNAYLSKPTSISALGQCLAGFSDGAAAAPRQGHNSAAEQPPSEELNGPAILDTGAFKRHTGGDDELAREFFQLFKTTLKEAEQQFSSLSTEGEPEAMKQFAHTLKSSAEAIGAQQLAALCRDIESEYDRDLHINQRLISRWEKCLAKLWPALESALSRRG